MRTEQRITDLSRAIAENTAIQRQIDMAITKYKYTRFLWILLLIVSISMCSFCLAAYLLADHIFKDLLQQDLLFLQVFFVSFASILAVLSGVIIFKVVTLSSYIFELKYERKENDQVIFSAKQYMQTEYS